MKAAFMTRTGGPDVLQLTEVPEPIPRSTQVVVKVVACGLCGHDQADRTGLTHVPSMPIVLGHEISGTVVDVGSEVQGFKTGDRVAANQFSTCGNCELCRSGRDKDCPSRFFNYGGYAEYVALEETTVIRVPEGVDLVRASVVACVVGTTLQALERIADLRPGEWVAVTGSGGGLGIHGLQVAKALGGKTIALTTSKEKIDLLLSIGADHVVLLQDEDSWKTIVELTDDHGVDVVLDNVGHPGIFGPCFRSLANRGRYVFTGQVTRDKVGFYPAFVFAKEATITGSASTMLSTFVRGMDLVRSGKVTPVVTPFPLTNVGEAHEALDSRRIFGRAVLLP